MTRLRLTVDPIACDGHGLCHDLFPEGIEVDDWGYPIVSSEPIGRGQVRHARRAVTACPRLALALVAIEAAPAGRRRLGS